MVFFNLKCADGYGDVDAAANQNLWGVIPRAVADIFEYTKRADEHLEFEVRVSHMEIYKEKLREEPYDTQSKEINAKPFL